MTDVVLTERDGRIARITLNRPGSNNALDEALIENLAWTLEDVAGDASVSTVVLSGAGNSFCAGADINWMRKAAHYSREQNIADVMPLGRLLLALDNMPQTTIARVQGAAYGGGLGLVAACDIAVGSSEATFCFSEVRLGVVPGMISPYVIRAIGARTARRYFQTAEVIDAAEAKRIQLLHEIVEPQQLDVRVNRLLSQLDSAAPGARVIAKRVATGIAGRPIDEVLMGEIAAMFADARASREGREGLSAFLEKRKASWY
jgi:methylglutaconyl-CoA hydratase